MKKLSFLFIALFVFVTNAYSQDDFFQPDDLFHIDHMDSHNKEFSLYFKVREKSILAKGENENYINDYPKDLYIYNHLTKSSSPLISYEWFPSQAKYFLQEYDFPVFPDDFGSQVGTTDSEPPVPILENTPALAQSGIGQFNVKATPLQMALVAAAIANDGILMKPHLMNSFTDQSGEIIEIYKPLIWQTVLSRQDALSLQLAMEITATSGTATNLAIPGIVVGGKTGTAQVDAERPDDTHGWIVGYAGPSDGESTLAIAVIVESSPGQGQLTGGADAAPIAKEVLLEALKTQGFLE